MSGNRIMKYIFPILLLMISCENEDKISILEFKSCKVSYPIYAKGEKILYPGHSITNEWELESAKNDLALCLCEKYLLKQDFETKQKILEFYREDKTYYQHGFSKDLDLYSILKNRKEIFYSKILID